MAPAFPQGGVQLETVATGTRPYTTMLAEGRQGVAALPCEIRLEEGEDAKHYQEKAVRLAIEESKK